MIYRVEEAIDKGIKAFILKRRIILPFKCHVLKITIGGETFSDTKPPNDRHIIVEQDPINTSIYFLDVSSLRELRSKHPTVYAIVADYDSNLADPQTHIPIAIEITEGHEAPIRKLKPSELYIE